MSPHEMRIASSTKFTPPIIPIQIWNKYKFENFTCRTENCFLQDVWDDIHTYMLSQFIWQTVSRST